MFWHVPTQHRGFRTALLIVALVALLAGIGVQGVLAQDDTSGLQEEIDAVRALSPTWTDSFRSDDGMWEIDDASESSSLTIESSNYRVGVVDTQIYAWGVATYEADNLLVEVDAYSIDGNPNNEFGIVLRHEDIDNFYTFLASSDGTYTVRRLEAGEWVDMVPWTYSDLIDMNSGAVNRVGAYANGETVALLINGTVVATVEDSTFSGGALGLAAGSFSDGNIVIGFDDISVWDLDNLGASLPVVPTTAEATEESTAEPTEEATAEATEAVIEEVTPDMPEEPTVAPEETPEPAAVDIVDQLDQIRNGEVTFADEFRRDEGNWHLPNDETTTTEIASRELSVHIIDPNWMGWARLDVDPVAEFLVEVDATQVEGATDGMYGVLFHFVDDANFDFFAISSDGRWAYWRLAENQWQELQAWTESEALATGLDATNRLGVLAEGGVVSLIVNGEAVGQFDDTGVAGKVALGVGTLAEGNATAVFDNLDLWSLDGLSVQPEVTEATSPEEATAEPTEEATAEATEEATAEPTEEATAEAPEEATAEATEEATAEATGEATAEATGEATAEATGEATAEATGEAAAQATEAAPEEPVAEVTPVPAGEDASALAAMLSAETADFTADFRRDEGEWSLEIDDNVDHYYQGRQLHLLVDRENWLTLSNSASLTGDSAPADFLAEVDTTFVSGPDVNEYGLAFRVVDTQNFYAFFLSGNGYWNLSKLEAGQWVTLSDWTVSDTIGGMGEVNRIGVLAQGEQITLFVNGEQVGQVVDDSFDAGGIALVAGTFDEVGFDAAFDNFALWNITE